MSARHEREYRLAREREIRAAAHRQRMAQVKESNDSFLRRYEDILQDLVQEGLEQTMASEFAYVRQEIQRIRQASDAFQARDWSMELGQRMRLLPRQAREKRRIDEEQQRLEQEEQARQMQAQLAQLKAEKENAWNRATRHWENKRARNLAFKALAELRQRVAADDLSVAEIEKAVETIKQEAYEKALIKEQSFTREIETQSLQSEKVELVKALKAANLPLSQTQRLEQKIQAASQDDLIEVIKETHSVQDEVLEDEAIRKEMVKAVYQALKQAGFTVLNPIKQQENDDVVLIQASRPSGNQAKFRVRLDGSVIYEFDNYKGQQCKKDMEQVLPKLSEIYGVNLSKERVLWENPDDEKMDAKPIAPIQTKRTR